MDARHTGTSPYNGPTGPAIAPTWTFSTGSPIGSAIAVGPDGVVVVVSGSSVYAVEGATGFLRWQYRTGGTTSQSPAIGVDGTVYAPSEDGALYALQGTTGTLVWKFPTPDGGSPTAPAVDDDNGVIVVGSYNDHVYCVRIRDGTLLWTAATGWHIATQPALWGGLVFVGSMDKSVYALQRDTGAQVWNYTTDAYIWCSAAVDSNGTVFVGSCDHNLCVQHAPCT